MWEKGRSSHHEVVSDNKDLETSAFIFLTLVIISVDGQHTVDFFSFVFTVIQEYLLKKKKIIGGVTPSLKKDSAVLARVSIAPGLQVQQSCAWEAAGAAGHGQLYPRCHLSTPTKAVSH